MAHEYYIGLMSGTSMDSVDAVLADFTATSPLLGSYRLPFPEALRAELVALCAPGPNEIVRMGQAERAVAELFALAVHGLLQQQQLSGNAIQAIGSHGQTIRHHPELGFSLQIGDPNLLAERTSCTVVADFRRRDIAAGGQGAPLVPAFHAALWRQPGQHRCILNLGDIANITWLDARPERPVTGFDTGPANLLMDAWMQRHCHCSMDQDGRFARSGQLLPALLAELLRHPYFLLPPPKSTGRETFNLNWVDQCLTSLSLRGTAPEDVMRTLLELTALSATESIASQSPQGELIVCGGGAYNRFLLERLQALLPHYQTRLSSCFGIAPEWVEALAFAWLARRRLQQQSSNLPEVTGASGLRCLGGIYPP